MSRRVIRTHAAPEAAGPYSQAIVHDAGPLVWTAGQIGLDPATGNLADGDISAQTEQVLHNLKAVLEAAGSNLENVVMVNVYLSDIKDFQAMNAIYTQYFTDSPPARAAVESPGLPKGALVEISCVAAIADSGL